MSRTLTTREVWRTWFARVLGAAQCLVLRRTFPHLSASRWIGVTALAAGFAWSVVLLAVDHVQRLGALAFPVQLAFFSTAGTGVPLSLVMAAITGSALTRLLDRS